MFIPGVVNWIFKNSLTFMRNFHVYLTWKKFGLAVQK